MGERSNKSACASFLERSSQFTPRHWETKFQFHFGCCGYFGSGSASCSTTLVASRWISSYIITSSTSRFVPPTTTFSIKFGNQYFCSPVNDSGSDYVQINTPFFWTSIQSLI